MLIEIAHQHGCSPVNILHIFGTPFSKNTSEGLFLEKLSEKAGKVIGKQLSWKIFEYSCKPEFCIHM